MVPWHKFTWTMFHVAWNMSRLVYHTWNIMLHAWHTWDVTYFMLHGMWSMQTRVTRNLHAWLSMKFTHMNTRVFMALLITNSCITSSNNNITYWIYKISWSASISITRLLSLLSRSSALIVAHIIKNKFSSAYCYGYTSISRAIGNGTA